MDTREIVEFGVWLDAQLIGIGYPNRERLAVVLPLTYEPQPGEPIPSDAERLLGGLLALRAMSLDAVVCESEVVKYFEAFQYGPVVIVPDPERDGTLPSMPFELRADPDLGNLIDRWRLLLDIIQQVEEESAAAINVTPVQLHAAITALFAGAVPVIPILAGSKLYETWVFVNAVHALTARPGWRVEFRGIQTGLLPPLSPFIIRGNPGRIYSTAANYGFAVVRPPAAVATPRWELHLDAQYQSIAAGVTFGLDVSIIRRTHATACRTGLQNPAYNQAAGVCECKLYSSPAALFPQSTSFVGWLGGMGGPGLAHMRPAQVFCSNTTYNRVGTYLPNLPPPLRVEVCMDFRPAAAGGSAVALNNFQTYLTTAFP